MGAKGVNKVILVGNLGSDPETRSFPDGGTVTNVSIATSESWKDKQTGQMQERTEWHRVVFRDRGNFRLGQIAGEYLKKGAKVYVEGSLHTRKWQDKDGQDRYITEIIAEQLQMLSYPNTEDGQHKSHNAPPQGAGRSRATTPGQRRGPDPAQAPPAQQQDYSAFDDDIPF